MEGRVDGNEEWTTSAGSILTKCQRLLGAGGAGRNIKRAATLRVNTGKVLPVGTWSFSARSAEGRERITGKPQKQGAVRQPQAPRRPPWPGAGRGPVQQHGTAGWCWKSSAAMMGARMGHSVQGGKSCHQVTPHSSWWLQACTNYYLSMSALCFLTLATALM